MYKLVSLGLVLFFAAVPSSTNYTLKSYDIGSGGTSSSSSTNYRLNGTTGTQSGNLQTSTNYKTNTGVNGAQTANVPLAPTLTNPSSYYDRLKLVLNPGSDPTDTKYLIAISSDNFVTTYYVQPDNAIGTSQAATSYQTYTNWGGTSGILILGLSQATTYQVKVKAIQGNFTGSAYGPTASAATVTPSLTMSLTTSLSSTPPFTSNFGTLNVGSVVNSDANIIVGITSNAINGGSTYVSSKNHGLTSVTASTTISSTTGDLPSLGQGYGAQVTSVGQTSGGPLVAQSPYNVSGTNVGGLNNALTPILSTNGPITGGSGIISLLVRATKIIPAASDYTDTLTLVTAMTF